MIRTLARVLYGWVRRLLWPLGFDLVRLPEHDPRVAGAAYDAKRPLPPATQAALRADHPRLLELRRRYAACHLPMAERTLWGEAYLARELDLRYFRGDNAYAWQLRHVRENQHERYYFYMREVAARDPRGLLRALGEDGAFGAWAFEYAGWPMVSRDLLDSVNELNFLDRHLGLLDKPGFTVLDIGAGYGRLAHRALMAAPNLGAWLCTDAVPESTFLCEFYLRFRGVDARAEVIPLDEVEHRLEGRKIDLAVNVHSFSEMSGRAISGWLDLLGRTQVPWLLVVPNDLEKLLTLESNRKRRDFSAILADHGYALHVSEPAFSDAPLRAYLRNRDHFLLFRRG